MQKEETQESEPELSTPKELTRANGMWPIKASDWHTADNNAAGHQDQKGRNLEKVRESRAVSLNLF